MAGIVDGVTGANDDQPTVMQQAASVALYPARHGWTRIDFVALIIFIATISFFWTRILREIVDPADMEK